MNVFIFNQKPNLFVFLLGLFFILLYQFFRRIFVIILSSHIYDRYNNIIYLAIK